MILFFVLLLFMILAVNGLMPLRKHRYQMQSPIDETAVIYPSNMTHLYTAPSDSCGHASLSCMAFGYTSSIPVRCGILEKVPLCQHMDPITQILKCDAFCDTDGYVRLSYILIYIYIYIFANIFSQGVAACAKTLFLSAVKTA
jgi:hypothetical protein